MGQKVNPISFRVGLTKKWQSNWYAGKEYSSFLAEDNKIRKYLNSNLKSAIISKIEIERASENLKINIYAVKPGLIIGRKGEDADNLRKKLCNLLGKDISLNIKETKKIEINAEAIAKNIAQQLEKRLSFRRVLKKTLQNVQRYKIDGCKLKISGRLNGAEMARTEWLREGRIPLHTLKANINYSTTEAKTTYGIIGIKVWIYNDSQNQIKRRINS